MSRTPKGRANGEGSIYFSASLKLWVATTRHQGKVKPFAAKLRKDAVDKRKTWLAQRDAGLNVKADKWLLGDWLDYVLERKQPRYDEHGNKTEGIEPTTWEKYEINVRLHTRPFLASVPLVKLTQHPEILERWQTDLRTKGRSAEIRKQALTFVSQALKLAMQRHLIQFNPADSLERPRPTKPKHVRPSEVDLNNLRRAIHGDVYEALVWLAVDASLRRGEVAALDWADVAFVGHDRAMLRAHGRVNRVGRRTQRALGLSSSRLERKGLKSQDERVVYIHGASVEALRRRWTHQLEQRLAAGPRWRGVDYQAGTPTGYVFTSSIGTPLDPDKIGDYFDDVVRRGGLDMDHFHALRRAYTSVSLAAGVPQRVIQEQAGHKDPAMTEYYQDPMVSQYWEAAEARAAFWERLDKAD